ncbi:MAG: type II toxin-antitoxin system Phd/YefM family antitoxin [Clostridia bacterium]|nr:MAG: type II toxin-antitoxin system Phd/YefM family antitoxin [Clostridia bacterium]
MERIAGINEARPKLTQLINSVAADKSAVIITVNSEPKAVLIDYEEYRSLKQTRDESKRLSIKLALADLRSRAAAAGITEEDVAREIKAYRSK